MSDAERYRRLAEQYHQLADGTADPTERDKQLKLARTWDQFAKKAELREGRVRQRPQNRRIRSGPRLPRGNE
jgi:hypothetical protein